MSNVNVTCFWDLKAALETLRSETAERVKDMEKEIEALRKAGRDRERDLDMLNTVLQCNQDVINVRTHSTHTHTFTRDGIIWLQNTHTPTIITPCPLVLSLMHRRLYMSQASFR